MARNRYTNTTYGDSSAFNSEDIMKFMQMYTSNQYAKAAEARATSNQLMLEADHKYRVDQRDKVKHSADAMNTFSSKGLDFGLLAQPGSKELFQTPIANPLTNFDDYKASMASKDIRAEDDIFWKKAQNNKQRYATALVNKYNALYETVKNQPQNVYSNQSDLYKFMAKTYGGDELYANIVKSGFRPEDLGLEHVPSDKGTWAQYGKSFFKDPDITHKGETVEGKLKALNLAAPAAAVGFGELGIRRPYIEGRNTFVNDLTKDWARGKAGLDAKAFKKKYGYTKTALGGKTGKKKIFELLEQGKKLSQSAGREATVPYKLTGKVKEGYESLKNIDYSKLKPDEIMAKLKNISGKSLIKGGKASLVPAMTAQLGAAIGEKTIGGPKGEIGGAIAGGYGGWKGFKKVMNKLKDPKTVKSVAAKLNKMGMKSLATKLTASGIATIVPEGVSTALGVAGLAWSAYDIMKIAQAVPELFED